MSRSQNVWLTAWYGNAKWVYLLWPVSWVFRLIACIRKFFLTQFFQQRLSVPVIVVGNIALGGTGKTPLIIEMVKYLQQRGSRPGVVSRGYGGTAPHYPYLLSAQSSAAESGDEPKLIFNATGCHVCVSPDRVAAAKELIRQGCTHILSDDGLQHYALGRDFEIALIDGQRWLGNKMCLPVGPLREPAARLNKVDMVVLNSPSSPPQVDPSQSKPLTTTATFDMHILPIAWRNLINNELIALNTIKLNGPLNAVAAIGNPQRFFNTLDQLSLNYTATPFPDHHVFTPEDFSTFNEQPVVMTEKDAVKCQRFAKPNWYSLVIAAQLSPAFWLTFQNKLDSMMGTGPKV